MPKATLFMALVIFVSAAADSVEVDEGARASQVPECVFHHDH